ncbi:MAG: PA14 domain-containing protein [Akkermansia sp.]
MSIHINMTDEAEQAIRSQKVKNTATAIITATLSAALVGLLLYTVTIIIATPSVPEVVAYVNNTEDAPVNNNPVTPERVTSRASSSSAPNQASIITSTAASEVAIATVDVDVPQMVDLGQSQDLGVDFGAGVGSDLGTGGGGFGDEKPSGSALEGTFYDFKQTQGGRPTDMTPDMAAGIMKEFITKSQWNETTLAKYYKSPTKLYASHIFISRRSATEAPKAYKCADKVKDSRWCAIYKGTVQAPKSGKFRFVGAGDDNISVRFNNKNVFDYGWFQLALGKITANPDYIAAMKGTGDKALQKEIKNGGINTTFPMTLYTYSTTGEWNQYMGGLAAGETFTVEAGKKYPIQILVTEIPGGLFGAVLLIEEVGVPAAKKDKTGSPIIPLFRTNYGLPDPEQNKGEAPPFDPIGPVWQVVK